MKIIPGLFLFRLKGFNPPTPFSKRGLRLTIELSIKKRIDLPYLLGPGGRLSLEQLTYPQKTDPQLKLSWQLSKVTK